MCSAQEMLRRLESVSKINTLREMVYEDILANEKILLDLKEEEFEMGNIRSNFTTSRYKLYDYAREKNEQNPMAGFGNVDLIRSGSFLNSFKLKKPEQNKYLFKASDSKTPELIRKYGNIMSLNQETFNDFQFVVIKPLFVEKLRKIINKKQYA